MFERFLDAVNGCPDPDCRKSLKVSCKDAIHCEHVSFPARHCKRPRYTVVVTQLMADVFALQRIHADVLFRNDDYVAAEKAKAIGRLLEHLRRELREVAVPLVDAWNIPVIARSVRTQCLPCDQLPILSALWRAFC